jgi:hypothetical protein
MELEIETSKESAPRIVAKPSHERGIFVTEHLVVCDRIVIEGVARARVAKAARLGDTSELKERCFTTFSNHPSLIVFDRCRGAVSEYIGIKKSDSRFVYKMHEYNPRDQLPYPSSGQLVIPKEQQTNAGLYASEFEILEELGLE